MGAFYIKYDTNVALISSFDVDELWFKLDKKCMKPLGLATVNFYNFHINDVTQLNSEMNK